MSECSGACSGSGGLHVLCWGCDMCVWSHWYQPSHKELCQKSQYTVECSRVRIPLQSKNICAPCYKTQIMRTQLQHQLYAPSYKFTSCTIRTQLQSLKIVLLTIVGFIAARVKNTCLSKSLSVCLPACLPAFHVLSVWLSTRAHTIDTRLACASRV